MFHRIFFHLTKRKTILCCTTKEPKVLTEEQIGVLKEEIKQKEKQYLPITKLDIPVYIYIKTSIKS